MTPFKIHYRVARWSFTLLPILPFPPSFPYLPSLHMHHEYYVPPDQTDHQQAQVDIIDEVLKWSEMPDNPTLAPKTTINVGCEIKGLSRHISRKYPGCRVEGITLSPYQADMGKSVASWVVISVSCNFRVADALKMPFDGLSFDLVWIQPGGGG